jgi:hypothetical protein
MQPWKVDISAFEGKTDMSSKYTPTRRDFLIGTAVTTTSTMIPFEEWFASKAAAQTTTYTRRNVNSLSATDPVLTAYKNAIVAMRNLPNSDSRSWTWQANVHGVWGQCQHGSFFFVSWHRMYLYFFERAVRVMSGNAQFALPYWNYYDNPSLPQPFRVPANSSNPLYVQQRSSTINAGSPMPLSAVDHRPAFKLTNFTEPPAPSFGGPPVQGATMSGPGPGQLENTPHNTIHNQVGGATGWMSSLYDAPRDPIFWLHHCNIDRLWKLWLDQGGGRVNPTNNSTWMNQSFLFYDENGAQVWMTGSQILDTTSARLGYTYG